MRIPAAGFVISLVGVAACPPLLMAQPLQSVLSTIEHVMIEGQSRPVHRIVTLRASGEGGLVALLETNRLHGPAAIWGKWDAAPPSAFLKSRDIDGEPDEPRRAGFDVGLWLQSPSSLTYSAPIGNRPWSILADAPGFLDSTWTSSPAGDQCIVLEGLPVDSTTPELGYWTWQTSPMSGASGTPVWHAGIAPAAGGLSDSSAVYGGIGAGITRQLGEGDMTDYGPGVDSGLAIRSVDTSPVEGQIIAICRLWGLEADRSQAVIRVRPASSGESHLMHARLGGRVSDELPGRSWAAFHRCVVSDSVSCNGIVHWGICGEIDAPRDRDSVLIVDGGVRLREGQQTPAGTLINSALAVDMSSGGDTAVVWAAESPSGAVGTHVFFGASRLFGVGDWFSQGGSSFLITHVYPILAIGDSPSGIGIPVYAVVQSANNQGVTFQAVVRAFADGLPQRQCDPDLNQDGSADQSDVVLMIDVISGAEPPPGFNADVNCDGSVDQADLADFMMLVAGGPCP